MYCWLLYMWRWGRLRVSEGKRGETATTSTSHIFECWAEISLATNTGENQSAVPCDNDVISEVKWRVAKYGDPYSEFVLCI